MRKTVGWGRNSDLRPDNDRFLKAMFQLSRAASDHGTPVQRRDAASELLHKALSITDPTLLAGSIESWNIAETGDRRFEGHVPILTQPDDTDLLQFYFAVILLRRALGSVEVRRQDYSDKSPGATAWGHFLMGYARRKIILQADTYGRSSAPCGIEITTGCDGAILDIALGHNFLWSFREKHSAFLADILAVAKSCAAHLRDSADGPRLHKSGAFAEHSLSELLDLGAQCDVQKYEAAAQAVLLDLDASALERAASDRLAELFELRPGSEVIVPFIRQLVFQALACPVSSSIRAVGFVPDVAFRDPSEHVPVTSTALQLFLSQAIPLDSPLWKMWAALVSMVGREKSVYDFSRRMEQFGYQEGEVKTKRHFAHELRTSIAALTAERDQMSDNGKLALDYVTLWQRFAANGMAKYGLPRALSDLFGAEREFIQGVLRLSLIRLSEESKIPSWRSGRKFISLSPDDMMRHIDSWLDLGPMALDTALAWARTSLPSTCKISGERMLQAIILTASIGAFYHLLGYVFADNALANSSVPDIFAVCRKGRFEILADPQANSLTLHVRNTGQPASDSGGQVLSTDKFGSNKIGPTRWDLEVGCALDLQPACPTPDREGRGVLWDVRITMMKERIGDEDSWIF